MPNNALYRTASYEKLDDYAAMGIPHIWVVDPRTATFKRYAGGSLTVLERFEFAEREMIFDLSEFGTLLQD